MKNMFAKLDLNLHHAKLSLLIPCYNASQFIDRLMLSIIFQKEFLDKKVILIFLDDGSTDDTYKILLKYSNRYKNNITLTQQKNKGIAFARKKLVEACITEYFVFIDSDDYLRENALACYFDAISRKNNLSFFRSTFSRNKFCKNKYSIEKYVSKNSMRLWNIVIKRSFYLTTQVSYLNIRDVGEDCFIVYWLLLHSNSKQISFSSIKTYTYSKRIDSYTNNEFLSLKRVTDFVNNFLLFITKSTKIMKKHFCYQTILNNYVYKVISVICYEAKKYKFMPICKFNLKNNFFVQMMNAIKFINKK